MPFPHRLAAAGAALAACLAAFVVLLWDTQVTNGPAYAARAQRSIAQMETVPAARGRLLDRNGAVLVQDQVTWQAQVDQKADPAVRQRLAALCREEGVAWSGTGPVEEVTPRLLVRVKEEGLSGVTFTPVAQRVGQGTLAPHVLGRVGQMSPEEWETYGTQGYTMDALVGKDGAEAAFEAYLHGIPGQRMVKTDEAGRVTSTSYAQEPQAGQIGRAHV